MKIVMLIAIRRSMERLLESNGAQNKFEREPKRVFEVRNITLCYVI